MIYLRLFAGLIVLVLHGDLLRAVHAVAPYDSHSTAVPFTSLHMMSPTQGWATTSNEVLRTVDGGLHWQTVTPPRFSATDESDQFLDASTAWVAIAHADATVTLSHTDDGGHNWKQSSLALHTMPAGSVPVQIDFITPRRGWLLILGGTMFSNARALFETTDAGKHWSLLTNHPPISGLLGFFDSRTGWGSAEHAGGIPANPGGTHSIYVTRDGGRSWRVQFLPGVPGYETSTATFLPRATLGTAARGVLPMVLFAMSLPRSTAVTLYITPDRGRTWLTTTPRPIGILASAVTLSVLNARDAWVLGDHVLYSTQDAGRHWHMITPSGLLADIAVLDYVTPHDGFALRMGLHQEYPALLHTADGGRVWHAVSCLTAPPPQASASRRRCAPAARQILAGAVNAGCPRPEAWPPAGAADRMLRLGVDRR